MGFGHSDADFLSSLEPGASQDPEDTYYKPGDSSDAPLPGPGDLDDAFSQLDLTDGTLMLPRLSMEPDQEGFGQHYDEVFELSSDDEDALDVEEYRRIAIECARSFSRTDRATNDSDFDPAQGSDNDEDETKDDGDHSKIDDDGMERYDREGGPSLVGEATHWRSEAEKYFHECTRLRSMVLALRSTFEEVEEENEELHLAVSMAHREILTLNYHLDVKQLETETLVNNFQMALEEIDDSQDIVLRDLQAEAVEVAKKQLGPQREFDPEAPEADGGRRRRTDWKAKAAAKFVAKSEAAAKKRDAIARSISGGAGDKAQQPQRTASGGRGSGSTGRKMASGALSGLRAAREKIQAQPAVKELRSSVEDHRGGGGSPHGKSGRFSRLRAARSSSASSGGGESSRREYLPEEIVPPPAIE